MQQGVSERVNADWKAIRAANTDAEFGDVFYAEIKAAAPDFLQLFVRPKALQYSTFVDQVLSRFIYCSKYSFYGQLYCALHLAFF